MDLVKSVEDVIAQLSTAKSTDLVKAEDNVDNSDLLKAIEVDEFLSGIAKSVNDNSDNLIKALAEHTNALVKSLEVQKSIAETLGGIDARLSKVEGSVPGNAAVSKSEAVDMAGAVQDRAFAKPVVDTGKPAVLKGDVAAVLMAAKSGGKDISSDIMLWDSIPAGGEMSFSQRVDMLSPLGQSVIKEAYPGVE